MKKHPYDIAVGARIRAKRLVEGVSQKALAEAVGITFQQIQKYENATNRISASALVLVARQLHCRVGDFFDGMEQGDENFAEAPLSDEAIKLAKRFDAVRDPIVRGIMVRTLGAFEKERPVREFEYGR